MPSCLMGSSPLTRGKSGSKGLSTSREGLIPAHAGKISSATGDHLDTEAHPRSRGENAASERRARAWKGSSPLTRGKFVGAYTMTGVGRLIPAHAGKICLRAGRWRYRRAHPRSRGENGRVATSATEVAAHPRSRGENFDCEPAAPDDVGSSPLTRGKSPGRP